MKEEMKNKKIDFYKTSGDKPVVRRIGANIRKIFMEDEIFIDKFRFNFFLQRPETIFSVNEDENEWVGLEPDIIQNVTNEIQMKYPYFDTGMGLVIQNEILTACRANQVSPPLEYIKSIEWDKEDRLNTWISKVFKIEDNPYHRYIGRQWIKHMVQRLKYPGRKFDNILIIEGDQGAGKSTSLRVLANLNKENLFNETTNTPDNGKDFIEQLQGNIIMEFAEGAIMGYKNQNKLKAFITEQSDKYRPPYAKNLQAFPRQIVFAMTTNDKEYLRDSTGERRYWPIEIPTGEKADSQWIDDNRDQLFAEALLLAEEVYQEMPNDVLTIWSEMIESRKEYNQKLEFIINWYDNLTLESKEDGVSYEELKSIMDNEDDLRTEKIYPKDITSAFTKTLFLKKKRITLDDKTRVLKYIPTERTPKNNGNTTTRQVVEDNFNDF